MRLKVRELAKLLEDMPPDDDVVIPVKLPYATMGGSPCVSIMAVFAGFDWDRGKVFLHPEYQLEYDPRKEDGKEGV